MPLDRQSVLAKNDRRVEELQVPEWGDTIYVRSLTAAEVKPVLEADGDMPVGLLVALAACDESGEALFSEEDIPALEAKNLRALKRIVEKAVEINGLTDEATEKILGNSGSGQENGSTTD